MRQVEFAWRKDYAEISRPAKITALAVPPAAQLQRPCYFVYGCERLPAVDETPQMLRFCDIENGEVLHEVVVPEARGDDGNGGPRASAVSSMQINHIGGGVLGKDEVLFVLSGDCSMWRVAVTTGVSNISNAVDPTAATLAKTPSSHQPQCSVTRPQAMLPAELVVRPDVAAPQNNAENPGLRSSPDERKSAVPATSTTIKPDSSSSSSSSSSCLPSTALPCSKTFAKSDG